jgi:polynucleotide 5'-kinase involved in rRNA processing
MSRLYEQVTATDERLAHAWVGHIARALKNDITVELGESGDSTNSPLSLAEVAVDLPSSFKPRHETPSPALKLLVERGDQVLSPALTPAVRDRIVVLGGPGSGKSTLSRLLCQVYRVVA